MLFLLHKPICDFMSTKFRNKQLIGKRGAPYIVLKHVYLKKKKVLLFRGKECDGVTMVTFYTRLDVPRAHKICTIKQVSP